MKNYNLTDKYKLFNEWTIDLVKEELQKTAFPFAVMMEQFVGDFTIGSVIRSCNAFNGKEVYYYGNKKYDKRGTVGTHNYSVVKHLANKDELIELKNKYKFVALENTVPNAKSIYEYKWEPNSLIIIGEEGVGITKETLSLCDDFVFIKQYGSVRSLNAAVAGSVAMNSFVQQYVEKHPEVG